MKEKIKRRSSVIWAFVCLSGLNGSELIEDLSTYQQARVIRGQFIGTRATVEDREMEAKITLQAKMALQSAAIGGLEMGVLAYLWYYTTRRRGDSGGTENL